MFLFSCIGLTCWTRPLKIINTVLLSPFCFLVYCNKQKHKKVQVIWIKHISEGCHRIAFVHLWSNSRDFRNYLPPFFFFIFLYFPLILSNKWRDAFSSSAGLQRTNFLYHAALECPFLDLGDVSFAEAVWQSCASWMRRKKENHCISSCKWVMQGAMAPGRSEWEPQRVGCWAVLTFASVPLSRGEESSGLSVFPSASPVTLVIRAADGPARPLLFLFKCEREALSMFCPSPLPYLHGPPRGQIGRAAPLCPVVPMQTDSVVACPIASVCALWVKV